MKSLLNVHVLGKCVHRLVRRREISSFTNGIIQYLINQNKNRTES